MVFVFFKPNPTVVQWYFDFFKIIFTNEANENVWLFITGSWWWTRSTRQAWFSGKMPTFIKFHTTCATRVFYLPSLSRIFNNQLSQNFHRFVIFGKCWDTQSEMTGLYRRRPVPLINAISTKCLYLEDLIIDTVSHRSYLEQRISSRGS